MTTLTFKPEGFSEEGTISEIKIPNGKVLIQTTGGTRNQIKIEEICFPDHPIWKNMDSIREAFRNQDDVEVSYGGTTYTGYKISTLVWEERGGLIDEREVSLTLTKVV